MVKTRGLKIRGEAPMDGNCCFWSISDQLDRLGLEVFTHGVLRQKTVNYLSEMPKNEQTEISNFLTEDIDTYIERMSNDGTYADHIVINCLSKILGLTIRVVHAEENQEVVVGDHDHCLVIGYLPDIHHYVSLEPISYEPDDFVGVFLKSRRTRHFYIAKVLEVDGQDIKLKFMAKKKTDEYMWPDKDDISWQPISDVVQKLSNPELAPGRGLSMIFNREEIDMCLSTDK